jgi:hypothetical protein
VNRTADLLTWIDRLENHTAPSVTAPHRLAKPGELKTRTRPASPRWSCELETDPPSAAPSGAVIAGCKCPACSVKRASSSDTGHIDHTPGGSPDPYGAPAPAPKRPAVRLARVRVQMSHCGVAHCDLVKETGDRAPGTLHGATGRTWTLDPSQRDTVTGADLLKLTRAAVRLAWKGGTDSQREECASRTLVSFLETLEGVPLDAIPADRLKRGELYGRASNVRRSMEAEARHLEGWGDDFDGGTAPPPAARLELTPDPRTARAHAVHILDLLGCARLGRVFPAVYAVCRAVQGVTVAEDARTLDLDPDTAQTRVRRAARQLHSARVYGPKSHRLALHLDDAPHRVYHGVRFDPAEGQWRGDGAAQPDPAPVQVRAGSRTPASAPTWTLALHPATKRRLELAASRSRARTAQRTPEERATVRRAAGLPAGIQAPDLARR